MILLCHVLDSLDGLGKSILFLYLIKRIKIKLFVKRGQKNYECKGIYIHNVCIYSLRDVPELVGRREYFANKFHLQYDPVTYQCMEEWMANKIKKEETIKITDYCRLPFIKDYTQRVECMKG
jgi:hypothetical protein